MFWSAHLSALRGQNSRRCDNLSCNSHLHTPFNLGMLGTWVALTDIDSSVPNGIKFVPKSLSPGVQLQARGNYLKVV